MDVVDLVSVVRFRNEIFETHGQIDYLVNNAGMYFYPTDNPTEHFVQVKGWIKLISFNSKCSFYRTGGLPNPHYFLLFWIGKSNYLVLFNWFNQFQVQRTLETNYWGLKNVVNAFIPKLSENARIVNMSSNFSMLKMIPGRDIRSILGFYSSL